MDTKVRDEGQGELGLRVDEQFEQAPLIVEIEKLPNAHQVKQP